MNTQRLRYDPDLPLHWHRPDRVSGLEAHVRCRLTPDPAPPRDVGQETRDSINARYENLDKLNEVDRSTLINQYQTLNDILTGQGTGTTSGLDLLGTISDRLSGQQAAANTAQRTADLTDLEALGGRAVSAIQAANPQQKLLVDLLNQQAQEGLAAGSGLTAAESRQAAQSARSASAARGLGYGHSDVTGEVLASLGLGNQLQQQRRGFATQVAGINQSFTGDPAMAVLGRSSGVGGAAQNFMGSQQGFQQANAFDPNNAYSADVFSSNMNNIAASNIAGANNRAALAGAGLSAL